VSVRWFANGAMRQPTAEQSNSTAHTAQHSTARTVDANQYKEPATRRESNERLARKLRTNGLLRAMRREYVRNGQQSCFDTFPQPPPRPTPHRYPPSPHGTDQPLTAANTPHSTTMEIARGLKSGVLNPAA